MFYLGELRGEGAVHPGQQLVARPVLRRHRGVEHVDHGRPSGHGLQLLTGNRKYFEKYYRSFMLIEENLKGLVEVGGEGRERSAIVTDM